MELPSQERKHMTTDYKPMPPAPAQSLQDKYVSKNGFLPVGDIEVEVYVTRIRNRFGNTDAYVQPVRGHGAQWVKADRLVSMYVPN